MYNFFFKLGKGLSIYYKVVNFFKSFSSQIYVSAKERGLKQKKHGKYIIKI